jgi:hypothetical protein
MCPPPGWGIRCAAGVIAWRVWIDSHPGKAAPIAPGASFNDPDGNGWLLQEVKTRLPGRV